jgi:hypothetical protein
VTSPGVTLVVDMVVVGTAGNIKLLLMIIGSKN